MSLERARLKIARFWCEKFCACGGKSIAKTIQLEEDEETITYIDPGSGGTPQYDESKILEARTTVMRTLNERPYSGMPSDASGICNS